MKLKNILLMIIAFISLAFGMIGIFLPILPTTPFILLSATCFSVSSPRMLSWLEKSKYFGSYIENYRNKSGVPQEIKNKSIAFLWIGLTISIIITRDLFIFGILLLVGTGVTLHLLSLKTKEDV